MNKIRIKRVIIACMIISILFSHTAYAAEEDLSGKTFDEIVIAMNSDSNNMNDQYKDALRESMITAPGDRIIEEILNENNNMELRALISHYCLSLDLKDLDYEKTEHLIYEEDISDIFKVRLLRFIDRYTEYPLEKYVNIVRGTDGGITIEAMDSIMDYRFQTAIELADEILNDYSGPATNKVMAAINVRTEMIKEGYYGFYGDWEIRNLIDLCDSFLYDEYEDHTNFATNVLYNLSSLGHYYCFSYVVHCDKFDNRLKMYFIRSNEKYAGIFGGVCDDSPKGLLNANDALYVLKYAAGLLELNTYQVFTADVNGDGNIDATDALLILQKAAGLIERFPVQSGLTYNDIY